MRWAIWFTIASSGAIAAVLLIIWLAGGFARVGLDFNVSLALVLGIFFSSLLGIGLMALIFHSNRSGRDEDAHRMTPRQDDDRH